MKTVVFMNVIPTRLGGIYGNDVTTACGGLRTVSAPQRPSNETTSPSLLGSGISTTCS